MESKTEAIEAVRRFLERHEDDDHPATENSVTTDIHSAYQGVITEGELLGVGNTTLSAFTDSSDKYAEQPWFMHMPEYDQWIKPVLEDDRTLYVSGQKLGTTYFAFVQQEGDGLVEYSNTRNGRFFHRHHHPDWESGVQVAKIVAELGQYRINGREFGELPGEEVAFVDSVPETGEKFQRFAPRFTAVEGDA